MTNVEKESGVIDMIKEGLSYVSKLISASIFSPIAEGTERAMKNVEERIILIERRRILKKITSLVTIGFGGIFLIFALLFFLIEFFHWSNAAAFFSIGIIIFVIGLMLKAGETDR